MKRLIKLIGFVILLNFIIGLAFMGYAAFHVLSCFEGADITLKNIVDNNVSQEQYDIIMENAKVKGKQAAESLTNWLKPKFDFSDMPEIEYPYPTLDEIYNEEWERKNQESVKKGIDVLKDSEAELAKARKEGLKILEEAEKEYQIILEKSLNEADTNDK